MKQLVSSSGGDDRLKGKVLATIFYEPSTRTACSFIAAMQRLGGSVIPIYEQTSSVKKGESFEDTIRTLASFADAIVLRHPMKGSAVTASSVSSKPVINAGDGAGEHPTQALLDMYTIRSELGRIGGETERGVPMVIAFVGDLKNGRTVHSLSLLLARYAGDSLHFVFVSPPSLSLPDYIRDRLAQANTTQEHVESLDEVIRRADVLYMTRIQRERFETEEEYNTVFGCYCLDAKLMIRAKDRMIVMHPLPRLNEIHTDVDSDPRAAYFRQMENGMFMRMSVLSLTLLGRV
eukprot:CAMPEP_0182419656 /NCGR_PEP_ID=MMETSP1167-20130531/4061_1 /TAXON_ID=2988 /ORGANISM="Mallomonas Sp, Strain CCMP3275" /LENGTH=290 /DNA_ID=CAMNT_0024594689 /DNA_START=117 /DNA_END=989 /DNA_ORIENTATION=-